MEQTPPQPSPETTPKILTFEEFSFRDEKSNTPKYNNFFLYFLDPGHLKTEVYKKFQSENPDMARLLCDKIEDVQMKALLCGTSEALKPFDRDLYEAYKIMRSYGFSDKELFI